MKNDSIEGGGKKAYVDIVIDKHRIHHKNRKFISYNDLATQHLSLSFVNSVVDLFQWAVYVPDGTKIKRKQGQDNGMKRMRKKRFL